MIHVKALRAAAFFALLAPATAAQAQLFRAYVASDGSDANPCTLQQPCRLLPAALAAVAGGGEIWMLDSANYNTGPVAVTKSVTILAIPGALGSVVAAGGHAINIATAGVRVTLRNLVIVPLTGSGGYRGVSLVDGAALVVEGCELSGFTAGEAIHVEAAAMVGITNTTIRDSYVGINLQSGAKADVSAVRIYLPPTGYGIYVVGATPGPTAAAVSDSVVTGGYSGISGWDSSVTSVTRVSVTGSKLTNNAFGALASSGGGSVVVTVGHSLVTGSTSIGLRRQGDAAAVLESRGDNTVRHNASDVAGIVLVPGT